MRVRRCVFDVRYKLTIRRAGKLRWSICVNPLSTRNANAEARLIHIVKVGWQNAIGVHVAETTRRELPVGEHAFRKARGVAAFECYTVGSRSAIALPIAGQP